MANLQQIHADISAQYAQVALQLRELNIRERDLASALGVVVQQLQQDAEKNELAAEKNKSGEQLPLPLAESAQ